MRRALLILLSVGVLAGAGVCGWLLRPAQKPAALDVYFTCDTSGRIEPCGCFTGQFGGLTRVSTVLREAPPTALKFEVGDAIAGLEDFHVLQFRHLLRAYAALGYGAVNLGKREARLPAEVLQNLVATSPVPLISANVVDAKSGQPVAAAGRIIAQADGLKVGVIGVVDPAAIEGSVDAKLRVQPMAEALRREMPALRKKCGVLICLAFTSEAGMEALAREFYELNFILGGHVPQPSQSLVRVNQSWLLATTNQSRALGEVHARVTGAERALSEVRGDIALMSDDIPQDGGIAAMSRDYRSEVRKALLALDRAPEDAPDRVPGVAVPANFAGSSACAGCHPKTFASWQATKHAHAFESLVARDSDADPSCIACHAIGFREPGGYQRAMKGAKLVHVGCESCHGPAGDHVKQRLTPAGSTPLIKMRPVGAGQCVQCHHGEFSRPFTWEEFWPLVQHGKG